MLGIDPGTTGMGYALLALGGGRERLVRCGLVPVPPGGSAAGRLAGLADALDALIAEHRPSTLALERLYFNKNVRTAMAVSEARGIVLLCAARAGLDIAEYTPQQVKRSVSGSGAADKKAVAMMVRAILGLAEPIREDNVADAVAIALTHAQRMKYAAAVALAR